MADLDIKLRADARENRDRLLHVARDALAKNPAASLNSIGKMAGVGAGTLYRHFPTRNALLVAVYRREGEELVGLATQLLDDHPPLAAFLLWCERLARAARTKQGIAVALKAAATEEDHRLTLEPMLVATDRLLTACKEAGEMPFALEAQDFLALVNFLWQVPIGADGEARAKAMMASVLRGMGVREEALQETLR